MPGRNTHLLFFSPSLALQPQPFRCVSPAGTLIPFLLLLSSRCKYNCFFVCPQREKTASFLFSCSSAAIPPLSLCASNANPRLLFFLLTSLFKFTLFFVCLSVSPHLFFYSLVLALQRYPVLCLPPLEHPFFLVLFCSPVFSFLLFSLFNPTSIFVCTRANTHFFFCSLALLLQHHPFFCVPPA